MQDSEKNPLHCAAKNGHYDICKLILANTKDINQENDQGETPIQLAAYSGHNDVCKLIESYQNKYKEVKSPGKKQARTKSQKK